jgi:ribosomal protein S18 acetylase RimI-like enzyme
VNADYKIIDVTPENIKEHPGVVCFINEKNQTHHNKLDWLQERFKEGLRIKLLYLPNQKTPAGFVEYVPGEFAWRAVEAKGYIFIHCIWTNPKKIRNKGLGKALIDEVIKDAKSQNMLGVAVVVSNGSFMAKSDLFFKSGFESTQESKPYSLLVLNFKKGQLPRFKDFESQLQKYQGLNMIYSKQCPWVTRFIEEVLPVIKEKKLKINIVELKTPADAQNAPSIYSAFNFVYNGKLLSDHYISVTRFLNIVTKELKL